MKSTTTLPRRATNAPAVKSSRKTLLPGVFDPHGGAYLFLSTVVRSLGADNLVGYIG